MVDICVEKKKAAIQLADEINDMILQLDKAENVLDDVATKYFGKATPPEGWELVSEYTRFGLKVEIIADYLWKLRDMLSGLEAGNGERSSDNG